MVETQRLLHVGSLGPEAVLAFAIRLLELDGPRTALKRNGDWLLFTLAACEEHGTIELRIGPQGGGRQATLLLTSQSVPYLDQPFPVADCQFRLVFGLDGEKVVYCAVALHPRVLATADTVQAMKGKKRRRIGATYELRDGEQHWSELMLEASILADGKPIATSLVEPRTLVGELRFAELAELELVEFLLAEMSAR